MCHDSTAARASWGPWALTCGSLQPPPLADVPQAPCLQHVWVIRAVWAGRGRALAGIWGSLKSRQRTRVTLQPGRMGSGARRSGQLLRRVPTGARREVLSSWGHTGL